jgi:S-DNA-T family DNA segregation ATPase FtsK/SpoIIIE
MKIIKGESINEALNHWGIDSQFIKLSQSPQIVKYYFKLNDPQQITKALKLNKALNVWSGLNVECSQDGGFFCITTPTIDRPVISITNFKDIKPNNYQIILGIDENGQPQTKTIEELTHLLVAGTTGSGKSVCLNSIIMGLACYNKPEDLGLILIDPKRVEFKIFENLPHLIAPIITEQADAEKVLNELINKMESRYYTLEKHKLKKNNGEFKKIIIIIDELADLVLDNKNIKNLLIRLLQKARAAGIHFIIATQSPRASILSGLLLANIPSKMALTCASTRESVLILGHKGAEQLTGKGDAILKTPQSTEEKRIQIPLITNKQIEKLINGRK